MTYNVEHFFFIIYYPYIFSEEFPVEIFLLIFKFVVFVFFLLKFKIPSVL